MGFARMTALSAMAALAGVGGLYAATPTDGQGQRVVVERDGDGSDRIIVKGQDEGQDRGGRQVIIRKVRGGRLPRLRHLRDGRLPGRHGGPRRRNC